LAGGLVTVGSNQADVFLSGHLTSESSPAWKSKLAGFSVGQSVEITATIESVKLWTSFDDLLKRRLKNAPSREAAEFLSTSAYEFAIGSGLEENRTTPFIAVEIGDAKLH
jgi:hypothetical protein